MKKIYLLSALLSLIFACKVSNPVTGRKQLLMIKPESIFAECALAYHQNLQKSVPCTDVDIVNSVRGVAAKLITATEQYYKKIGQEATLTNYKWEVNVVQDNKTVNATCMPGGKIIVYTGILGVAKNADGLAAIMGHEIAHALANHGAERISQEILAQLGGIAVDVAAYKQDEQTRQTIHNLYGVGSQVAVLLPFSRKHESEADVIGLNLMALAGYNPHEAPLIWERMAALGNGQPPTFLSTHPSHESRIKNLREKVPSAIAFADTYNPDRQQQGVYAVSPSLVKTTPSTNGAIVPSSGSSFVATSPTLAKHPMFNVTYQGKGVQNGVAYSFSSNASKKSGYYKKIQLKTTSNYVESEFLEVKKLGKINLEFEPQNQLYYVLLGDFSSLYDAKIALNQVKMINAFKYAEIISYKDGDRQ